MRRLRTWLAVVGLAAAAAGAIVHAPAATAARYNDTCTYAKAFDQPDSWWWGLEFRDSPEYVGGVNAMSKKVSRQWGFDETFTFTGGGGIDLHKFIEISGSASKAFSFKEQRTFEATVNTEANQFVLIQPVALFRHSTIKRMWVTPQGKVCSSWTVSGKQPIGGGFCAYRYAISECPVGGSRPGGGGSPGPVGSSPPTGPQPVTNVRGLADGTLLQTTDTKRIYKMVGDAPIWQSTCDNDICSGTIRPTTQSVINAGPATPRNRASVVDQRGFVYLFVGGAPVWQDSCAAPVNCGAPVKVSNWSVDARDHMNRHPADGQLVQAKAGNTDLPVAATLGGALIPFANPQEVIDTGHGADWASKVIAISGNSYNSIGFEPVNGTLVQGTGGGSSTPVAIVVGNARINIANPQELIDTGYGTNWAGKVRAIPTRAFNLLGETPKSGTLIQGAGATATPVAAMVGDARINFANPQEVIDSGYGTDWAGKVSAIPTRAFNLIEADVPADRTLIQGTNGSTPVAQIVGGARVDFASPQEVIDAGYGENWREFVRAVPPRAFNLIGTRISDGVLLKKPGHDGIGVLVGGAWVPFWSVAELEEAGYKGNAIHLIPGRVLDALPRTIGDGVLLKKPGHDGIGVVVGGAWVPFWSMAELIEAGYKETPVHMVPGRVLDGLPTTIGDGVLLKKPGHDGIGVVVGGAWVPFWSMAELIEAGYKDHRVNMVPGRVLDGLPTTIGDGVRIGKAGKPDQGAVVGGAKVPFANPQELNDAGYGNKPLRMIPARVWDALPTTIGSGVRIGKAGQPDQGAVVGGAKIPFANPQELNDAGYGDKPLRMIPVRVWDALPTTIGDGTKIKAPDSPAIWVVNSGRRSPATAGGPIWTVPTRILNAIPTA